MEWKLIMKRMVAALFLTVFLGGCTTTESKPSPDEIYRAELSELRRVNANWSSDCTITNPLEKTRRCFLATSAQRISASGDPVGSLKDNFQIYYLNESGPYFRISNHNYPGRTPSVRVDDNQVIQLPNTATETYQNVANQMLLGKRMLAQFTVWPDSMDTYMLVDLEGFNDGWKRLQSLVAGEKSPWESVPRVDWTK